MVASLLLVVAEGKAHGCTVAATVVVAGSAAVEVGVADPRVGYTPYDTLEEHR
jgi:pseudouridine-5'-phosphate glycosidase